VITNRALSKVLCGIFILLISCVLLLKATSSANQTTSKPATAQLARLSDRISIHAAGRGNPSINLSDGRDIVAPYAGVDDASRALQDDLATPVALASADFDEDGVPDLVSAYAGPGGGIVTLHRGNIDSISPNSPEAQRRKANGTFTSSPLLSPARVFELPRRSDFIAAGDFDADGHSDLLVAARGGSSLYLLPGDGKGSLGTAKQIDLPGIITALATGEVNRADGLMDIAVGIMTPNGPEAMVFQGPVGAIKAQPEIFPLPARATALALGSLDEDYLMDLAVAAGRELLIVHGRDRSLIAEDVAQSDATHSRISRRSLSFEVRSLAIGHFLDTRHTSLALLSSDGALHFFYQPETSVKSHKQNQTIERWQELSLNTSSNAADLVKTRISSAQTDGLILIDPAAHQLHIVAGDPYSRTTKNTAFLFPRVAASLDLEEEPVAVLPIQLNTSALNDLMILKKGHSGPAVVTPQAMMTFTVVTAVDSVGSGSLRDAIASANANPGPDLIVFQIPPGGPVTIDLADALPTITDPVTINGATQPGFAGKPIVELNGASAGAGTNGLGIVAGNTTVRGLVINRCSSSGIALDNTGGNLIQGNFIGTNLAGDAASGNGQGGVTIRSTDNTVGGLTTGSGNLISGNTSWGVLISANNNRVQGNLIGTDVTGTVPLANTEDGVLISDVADNNIVGGVSARNIISGNGGSGVNIGGGPSGTIVQNNFIGINVNGVGAVGNSTGVHIGGSSGNTIGGGANGGGNVISGNVGITTGVLIDGGSSANTVARNFIGTNATGTAGIPNSGDGILIQDSASNIIGGVGGGLGNVVSGNFIGIEIAGNASSSNRVQGNFVGTNASGNGALGNLFEGVFINGAPNNTIGGAAGNVLSGNGAGALGHEGLRILGAESTGNVVQGNFIGTNAGGTAAIPNSGSGVLLIDFGTGAPSNTTIGGTTAAARNVLSGNAGNGIRINNTSAASNAFNNRVQGNFIGTDANGSNPLGNTNNGVALGNGTNNPIGGNAAGAGNVIAFNGRNGVSAESGIGNPILSNSIFSNSLLGIDLGDDGVTPNDPGDGDTGANNLQNFPVLTSVTNSLGGTIIQGSLNSTPNTNFTLQFFSNASCSASGFGEGQQLIGTRAVTTDGNGNGDINVTFGGTFTPVTATATDPSGNTSEFSVCVSTAAAVDLAVTLTAAPNPVMPGGSLTYTITATNKGTTIADNVTVADTLPGSVTFVSCSSIGGGICLGSGNNRQVGFGALLPGTSATITLVTRVNDSTADGTIISDTATITSPATDANPADNSATTTTAVSTSALALNCPPNIVQSVDGSQCAAVVQYPLPTLNIAGVNLLVNCSPASGSTFPIGTTTVICSARDAKAVRASCAFSIIVNAPLSVIVSLEGGGSALDLGPAAAQRKTKKPPKGCACDKTFTIQNKGCAALKLGFPSILRTGSDVTSGRITNADDSALFTLLVINDDGSEAPFPGVCTDSCITIDPGQKRSFRVLFKPGLPAFAGKTTGLAAAEVLPDVVTSRITLSVGTQPIVINLIAHVSTDVQIINPDNARAPRRATFTKSGNEFTVAFGVFDSDLDVNRARFEFLDSSGRVVAQAIDVDITQPIGQGNIIKGQSFDVVQKFTGAADHSEVASVRVTVSDPHSSDSITAQLGSSASSFAVIQSLQNRAPLIVLPVSEFQPRP
jgi:uncharacterized repeat protein (TIGR01451 family)